MWNMFKIQPTKLHVYLEFTKPIKYLTNDNKLNSVRRREKVKFGRVVKKCPFIEHEVSMKRNCVHVTFTYHVCYYRQAAVVSVYLCQNCLLFHSDNQAKLELWEIRQYHERIERERALEREKKEQAEAMRRAAELRAAALQRKQQEQQARQQQQNLLKMNKKKVQNAIKTQQRKGVVYKTTVANTPVTYKPTVTAPVPLGALRRTLSFVRPAVPAKPLGIQTVGLTPQMRTQIVPRTTVSSASTTTPFVQRLQPKPQVTQRAYTPSVPTQTSRANTSAPVPGNSHGFLKSRLYALSLYSTLWFG